VPKGTRSWEEPGWDGTGHCRKVNTELGSCCRFCYPGTVVIGGQKIAAHFWEHWGFKEYAGHGTCQDAVASMFWVSSLSSFKLYCITRQI
jgi:hypothetical protein